VSQRRASGPAALPAIRRYRSYAGCISPTGDSPDRRRWGVATSRERPSRATCDSQVPGYSGRGSSPVARRSGEGGSRSTLVLCTRETRYELSLRRAKSRGDTPPPAAQSSVSGMPGKRSSTAGRAPCSCTGSSRTSTCARAKPSPTSHGRPYPPAIAPPTVGEAIRTWYL